MAKTLVKIVVALLFFITPVSAADYGKVIYFGAGASLLLAPDALSDFWGTGYGIGGGMGMPIGSGSLVVQTFADYTSHPIDKEALLSAAGVTGLGVTISGASANIINVHVNLRATLVPDGGVSPYLVGGLGLVHASVGDITVIAQGQLVTESFSDTWSKVGFGLGAGIDIPISEQAGLFVEAKWMMAMDDDKTQTLPIRVGLFYTY